MAQACHRTGLAVKALALLFIAALFGTNHLHRYNRYFRYLN